MSTAWVTLAKNNETALYALQLASYIHENDTSHKVHLLYTPSVSDRLVAEIKFIFADTTLVDVLDHSDPDNQLLVERPDLFTPFTKLQCFRLVQYSKAVFIDPKCVMVYDSDELFSHPAFSAAPDVGWPDTFDTSVFVFAPSMETYRSLLDLALSREPFVNGDQGILNAYFSNWSNMPATNRLSVAYNLSTIAYNPTDVEPKIINLSPKVRVPWITYQQNPEVTAAHKNSFSKVREKFSIYMPQKNSDSDSDDENDSEKKKDYKDEDDKETFRHSMLFLDDFLTQLMPPGQWNKFREENPNFIDNAFNEGKAHGFFD